MMRRLSDERGIAMITVMGALLVTSILAFAVAATAQRTSAGTVRDSNSKRALAAAETGLNVGRFNVGKAFPTNPTNPAAADGYCYWGQPTPLTGPPPSACLWSAPAQSGNGATYTYTVSRVLATADLATCAAAAVPVTPANSRRRCVTAVGEMNGVRRQLQTLVVENRGAPLFPFPGMFGLQSVSLNQSRAWGTVGSNGHIDIGPGSRVMNPGNIVTAGPGAYVTGPFDGDEEQPPRTDPYVAETYAEWYATARGTNANGSLPANTLTGPGPRGANPPNGNGDITLTPGQDYNFCSAYFNSGETFIVPDTGSANQQPVRIFIDHPTRPGSPTPDCTGAPAKVIDVASGGGFVNNTGRASMLQVYVWSGGIEFHSSAAFVGTLWAPNSDVLFNSGATLRGAMLARNIRYNNNGSSPGFIGEDDADNVTGRWDGTYKRAGWRECSPRNGC